MHFLSICQKDLNANQIAARYVDNSYRQISYAENKSKDGNLTFSSINL